MIRPAITSAAAILSAATTLSAADGLSTPYLYHGVDRPVLVDVASARDFGTVQLALLDAHGNELLGRATVRPGRVDVAQVMPDIWRLRRAAWLQLIVSDVPEGAPLVIQPMLSRLVPIVENALNPSGIAYTRIIGWYDENHPPDPPEPEPVPTPPPPPPVNEEIDDSPALGAFQDADPILVDPVVLDPPWFVPNEGDQRLLTGVRVYVDADVVLATTLGDIRIALRPDAAPNTAWNFRHLIEGGFYRDIPFHRIVPLARNGAPFVIQAGDPTASGSGGPGFWLPIEPSALPHDYGVISMARDVDPDSAGSQIFFALSRTGTARLDGHYCSFGEAVDGAATIDAITSVELADVAAGRPIEAPRIVDARLEAAPPRAPGSPRPGLAAQARADSESQPAAPTRVPR